MNINANENPRAIRYPVPCLDFLEAIINNTDNLGIVSKEAIVSGGHIFKKKNYLI